MVQILDEVPSFGTMLARGLGQGISSGFEKGFTTAQKLAGERRKKEADRLKIASKSDTVIPRFLKIHHPEYIDHPEEMGEIEEIYRNLVTKDHHIPEDQARKEAVSMFKKQQNESLGSQLQKSTRERNRPTHEMLANLLGFGGKQEQKQTIQNPEQKNPNQDWRNNKFPMKSSFSQSDAPLGDLGESIGENLRASTAIAKSNPRQLLKEFPVAFLKSLEGLRDMFNPTQHFAEQLTGNKGVEASDLAGQFMRKGLTPEQAEQSEKLAELESFAVDLFGAEGMSLIKKGKSLLTGAKAVKEAKPIAGGFQPKGNKQNLGAKMAPAESAAAEFSPAKEAIQEATQAKKSAPLEKRVSKPAENATDMRVKRLKVNENLAANEEVIAHRKKQLKEHPKYLAEMESDEIARQARRAEKTPKTEVGEAGVAARVKIAEAKLPAIEDAYSKATARVRSIENAMVKTSGAERKQYEQLYDASKRELLQAQEDLQRGMSNLRGDSAKYTVQEATARSRKKIENITKTIEDGGEVSLSKADYNPKMIADAKALSKKKPLKHFKPDDFHNKILEDYLTPYRKRLGEVQADLKSGPIMFNTEGHAALKKEKDVLDKIIGTAEAKQLIHNHKLALREIGETKKASDRFKQLEKSKGNPKTQKVWKNEIREAKTPGARKEAIEGATEEAARKHPEQAESIRSEGAKLAEDVEEALAAMHGPQEEATIKNVLRRFANNYPKLSKFSADMLIGAASAIIDEGLKQVGVPGSAASYLTAASGLLDKGSGYKAMAARSGSRTVGIALTKWFIKKIKVGSAKRQYNSKDVNERRKFQENTPAIRKQALEEIRGNKI